MRHSAEGISPVPEQWLRVGFSGAGSKECLLFASFTVSPICAAGGIDRSRDGAQQIRRLSGVSRSAEGAGNASRKPDRILHCPGSRGNARAPVNRSVYGSIRAGAATSVLAKVAAPGTTRVGHPNGSGIL